MPPAAKLTTPLYTKKPATNNFLVGLPILVVRFLLAIPGLDAYAGTQVDCPFSSVDVTIPTNSQLKSISCMSPPPVTFLSSSSESCLNFLSLESFVFII